MSELGKPKYYCTKCGFPLSQNQTGSCPQCGNTEKVIRIKFEDSLTLTDTISRNFIREFFDENPRIKWLLNILEIGSIILGYFLEGYIGVIIGLFIIIISRLLMPYAIIKVREIRESL